MFVLSAKIECGNITDFQSLHDEFDRVFGFPKFYGKNMNAWIDCLSDLDNPGTEMTKIHVEKGKVLALELVGCKAFRTNYPEEYAAIVECSSFVNYRQTEAGQRPLIALVMDG